MDSRGSDLARKKTWPKSINFSRRKLTNRNFWNFKEFDFSLTFFSKHFRPKNLNKVRIFFQSKISPRKVNIFWPGFFPGKVWTSTIPFSHLCDYIVIILTFAQGNVLDSPPSGSYYYLCIDVFIYTSSRSLRLISMWRHQCISSSNCHLEGSPARYPGRMLE